MRANWKLTYKGKTLIDRPGCIRICVLLLALTLLAIGAACWTVNMPGESYRGALAPLDDEQTALAERLEGHVRALASGEIGPRNTMWYDELIAARDYLEAELQAMGYTDATLTRQTYQADDKDVWNIIAELPGKTRPAEIVVIGAHYDTAYHSPGANDNASGVAATLELARHFAGQPRDRTIRFVLFTNEEPPYFQSELMGSLVYARACREAGDEIVAMISLETIGYYSEEAGSQQYPKPLDRFYPDTGDFIGFVGSASSRDLVTRAIEVFRDQQGFPSEGAAAPSLLPGIMWSDHWAFEKAGYPAIMVTDTAPFRYEHYHMLTDKPQNLDYPRMSRVVTLLVPVITDLTDEE